MTQFRRVIVIDLDSLNLPRKTKAHIYENKLCLLTPEDFGKKTLLGVTQQDPKYLKALGKYEDAIFKIKDEKEYLKKESGFFQKVYPMIKWFRTGIILSRDKACPILLALLRRVKD